MSGQSGSPVLRLRNSEDKLYQSCLDACIQGIENIPVNRRCSATPALNNNTTARLNPTNNPIVERALTETVLVEPVSSLLFPPPSPERRKVNQKPSSPPPSSPPTANMDHSRLYGAPSKAPRGVAPWGPQGTPPSHRPLGVIAQHPNLVTSGWASGDARANLAVQPAANAGTFKLKKNVVKIVRAARSAPATPRSAAATPPVASSPALGSVRAQPKAAEGPAPATPSPALEALASENENIPKSNNASGWSIEDLAARLISNSTAVSPRVAEDSSLAGPDKNMFSFDVGPGTTGMKEDEKAQDKKTNLRLQALQDECPHVLNAAAKTELATAKMAKGDKTAEASRSSIASTFKEVTERVGISEEEFKNEYMRRAAEYIAALPDSKGDRALLIKTVSKKLRDTYSPDIKIDHENNEIIKAHFALATANYLKQIPKKGLEPRTTDSVKQTLKDVNGDFLKLCAQLVEEKYISLKTLDEITGLANNMLNSLPKAEPTITAIKDTKPGPRSADRPVLDQHLAKATKPASQDSVDSMTVWPTQAERENPAAHRTCILKGVANVTSIHQLQALVWGGKLESISMPEPGSSNAVIKFLTPAACEKYYKDTANGIEVAGDISNTVVFVEKAAGSNSIDDIIENCIDEDASRCVRAIGAEEDNAMLLMKMARGKSQIKREVDTIKQGKTARGHPYIEFRFANIYNALNFKKELMANGDWEHCTISYAPDPCELAKDVHYKDKDEEKPGFFA